MLKASLASIALALLVFCVVPDRNETVSIIRTDGGWNWFTNPRAIFVDGDAYFAHVGTDGDAIVSKIDGKKEDRSSFVLHDALHVDDHANPALFLRPDGRITAFYSAHNGADLFQRTTIRKGDISKWGDEKLVGVNSSGGMGYTYPNPIYLPSEKSLYLFWRGADWQPTFSVSSDLGKTWSAARKLIDSPGERPYVLYMRSGDGIHIVFSDGHPRETKASLFYAFYKGGSFYRADGSFIKSEKDLPLIPRETDIVYDAEHTKKSSWAWDVATDEKGKPVIAFARFESPLDHRYSYASYDGSWRVHEFARGGGYIGDEREAQYSGGMSIDPARPNTVYISSGTQGDFKIEKVALFDGGKRVEADLIAAGSENIRPIVARGADEKGVLLWMSGDYETYWRYGTAIRYRMLE